MGNCGIVSYKNTAGFGFTFTLGKNSNAGNRQGLFCLQKMLREKSRQTLAWGSAEIMQWDKRGESAD
jgi:hypothetical protein